MVGQEHTDFSWTVSFRWPMVVPLFNPKSESKSSEKFRANMLLDGEQWHLQESK